MFLPFSVTTPDDRHVAHALALLLLALPHLVPLGDGAGCPQHRGAKRIVAYFTDKDFDKAGNFPCYQCVFYSKCLPFSAPKPDQWHVSRTHLLVARPLEDWHP